MAHKIYENFVLSNKIADNLITALDLVNYVTTDYSLTQEAGMKRVINTYTATGDVEEVAMGEGNTGDIEVSFTPVEYTVGTVQGRFPYFDEQEMTDPLIVDTGLKRLSQNMVNDLTEKVIGELDKGTQKIQNVTWTFENIVDAIAKFNSEDETGLYLLINPASQAKFRKALKADLSYSEGYVRTGYIGHVCGVPVIVSKAVPEGKGYMFTKEAVTIFLKKGVEVETERDANIRKNTIYSRQVNVVAKTNDTKVVVLDEGAGA